MTTKYVVQGKEGVDVDVVGTVFKPGDTVELREDIAEGLIAEGKIAELPTEASEPEAPAEENVPVEDAQGADGSSETPSEGVAEEPRN